MHRPLLAICMGFVAIIAIWLVLDGALLQGKEFCSGQASRLESDTPAELYLAEEGLEQCPESWDGSLITVTGNVYRKDSKYFYLDSIDSVFIQNHAADQQHTISLTENLICEYEKVDPQIGSKVMVKGTFNAFDSATNPGEFDAAEYYHTIGIAGKVTDISGMVCSEEYSLWQETLFELRSYFRQRLYNIFPEKEASVMMAMLLGDKQELDGEIKELYQENGIIHILSISGLHITIIGMSIYKLLRRIGMPVLSAALIGGGILLLYGVMTGMSISACRAIGMYLIKMLAEVVGRTYDMLTAMGIMAAGMVCVNPLYLKNAGFLLSYSAILGIGIVYPALYKESDSVKVEKYEGTAWRRIVKALAREYSERLKQSMIAGLSITLTTLPVQLWFYYEVPAYSVLINLLVLPFMTVVMFAGLIAMLVPGLGIVGTIDCLVLSWYEWLCQCCEKLPFSTWNPGRPQVWQMVVYYTIMVLMMVGGERLFVRIVRSGLMQYIRIALLTALVGIFTIDFPAPTTVTFLDVDQGDCICIQLSSGEVYLFDCGSTGRSKIGKYVLKPYLKYCGISYVDAVFVSHPDEDHCNGVSELIENGRDWGITVGQLVVSGEEGALWAEETIGQEKGLVWRECIEPNVITIHAKDTWQVGNNRFLCLHPASDFETDDTNAGSQCFYMELEQRVTMLLTGDVEDEGEKCLLSELKKKNIKDIDILKVAHHGSKYSSGKAVLEQVSPQLAIISCGENNAYGHPHEEVLGRLKEVKSEIMTTSEYGAIIVEIGRTIEVGSWILAN